MKNHKIQYLEGIRGLAAVMVVLGHLTNTFAISLRDEPIIEHGASLSSNLLVQIRHSFTNLLIDGNLAVYIFWLMSAYVISIKLFRKGSNEYLYRSLIKRYWRLLIPVLGSILLAYVLLKLGFMYNSELASFFGPRYENGWLGSFYNFEPNFFGAVKSGFWNAFFHYEGMKSYNAVLWTMKPELYGSFFVFALFSLFKSQPARYFFYALIAIVVFYSKAYWLVSFILGFWLCDIDNKSDLIKGIMSRVFSSNLLNVILFLGILFVSGKQNYFGFFDLFLSFMIVLLVMNTSILQKALHNKFLSWLGRISFSLYLIHLPIICSFSCYLYLNLGLDHNSKIVLVSVLTLIISLLVSHVFTLLVDRKGIHLANSFANYIVKNDSIRS